MRVPTTCASGLIRFGVFEVDLRAGELRKNGAKIKLAGQPFQILALHDSAETRLTKSRAGCVKRMAPPQEGKFRHIYICRNVMSREIVNC